MDTNALGGAKVMLSDSSKKLLDRASIKLRFRYKITIGKLVLTLSSTRGHDFYLQSSHIDASQHPNLLIGRITMIELNTCVGEGSVQSVRGQLDKMFSVSYGVIAHRHGVVRGWLSRQLAWRLYAIGPPVDVMLIVGLISRIKYTHICFLSCDIVESETRTKMRHGRRQFN